MYLHKNVEIEPNVWENYTIYFQTTYKSYGTWLIKCTCNWNGLKHVFTLTTHNEEFANSIKGEGYGERSINAMFDYYDEKIEDEVAHFILDEKNRA